MNCIGFDDRIYEIKFIMQAIEDYNNIASISYIFNESNHIITLTFKEFTLDFELIKNEFCNYLIELIATNKERS